MWFRSIKQANTWGNFIYFVSEPLGLRPQASPYDYEIQIAVRVWWFGFGVVFLLLLMKAEILTYSHDSRS